MSFITTVQNVKTVIPNQAIVDYLVKDYLIEEKIKNVTVFIKAFLSVDYKIVDALIASLLGVKLTNHIGIQDVSNVYYFPSVGSQYGTGYNGSNGSPTILTKDIDYIFKFEDTILDEVYKVPSYTLAFSRQFIEQIIYQGIFQSKEDLGYVQYQVVGGNDDGNSYNLSVELQVEKPFFMDSIRQQSYINDALKGEAELAPIIQLLGTYIVAKDVIVEYILPVFKIDQVNELAGVDLNAQDLLPGYEEFIDSLNDKIADIWALLKFKGRLVVNPNGPNGPDAEPFANKAKTVVRGAKKQDFRVPFSDSHDYLRSGEGIRREDILSNYLNSSLYDGI